MLAFRTEAVEPLFASPLFRFRLPDAAALNDRLLPAIALRRAKDPGLDRSNQLGWHSGDGLFRWREEPFPSLCAALTQAAITATRAVAPAYVFGRRSLQAEGWVNVNGPGAYNTPHDHAGWAWSGTYYVQVPPSDGGRSGLFEALDPRLNANVTGIEGAACFASKMQVLPESGLLILFPAYLRHWVYPNASGGERVSIACNFRFAPVRLPPA